jgi:hypothetical protein
MMPPLRSEKCYVLGFLSFNETLHTSLFISMLYRRLLRLDYIASEQLCDSITKFLAGRRVPSHSNPHT